MFARRRRHPLDHPVWCAATGALLGIGLSAALVVAGVPDRPAHRPGPLGADPTAAFVAAWQAHLSTSWSVDEVERRTTTSGATISFRVHEAQRPPDSVFAGGTTVSARRGQTLIACATAPGATTPVCREQPTTQSWAEGVTRQIADLTAALTGPRAMYRVTDLGGACYRLGLTGAVTNLPVFLDRGAEYCFDEPTHAVRMSVIQRVGAVDTTTILTLHAPATDADLALPAGARYER